MVDPTTHPVLVLNYAHEPIKVISWQRAVTLFYLEKVDVLSSYPITLHAQFVTIQVPAVVRLKATGQHHYQRVRFRRDFLYARDSYTCQYCGRPFPYRQLTFDHVQPKSRGGLCTWENIVTACKKCNSKKDRRTPGEAHLRLHKKPLKPKWFPPLLIGSLKDQVPELWKPFVEWISPPKN